MSTRPLPMPINPALLKHADQRGPEPGEPHRRLDDVRLEAIFLSTFVMISQNRADAKRQVIVNEQWQTVRDPLA